MGRNQKQANRTKNNAKPSSSSRSAELLGSNIPAFVGFSANQEGGYVTVLPGFSSNDALETSLDPNLQLVFRKMCKKDSVTKLKALNEYVSFINMSDEQTVLQSLSLWPRLYGQLSGDTNHRVREAAQVAHGALVSKCGRNVAPYLKQMVPVWITSQFDTYAAAKVQAKDSFNTVFPGNKKSEVMAFCKNEILSFIIDNLIDNSSLMLANTKSFSPEEREFIYERTTVTSLQGYEFFINNLPEAHLEWLCEDQEKILKSSKFWELGQNKIPIIRSSFYSVIGSLAKRVTNSFESKYGEKASKLLFGKLCENDAEVIVALLENAILLMAYIPEWSKYTDVNDKLFPCIISVLSSGGWNNPTRIAPLMAPLLVHLSNIPNAYSLLFDEFIEAVCRGLEQRSVILSKTSYDAWLNGLTECLEYIANNKFLDEKESAVQTQNLTTLSKAIRSWLSSIIRPKITNSCFDYVKLNILYISRVSFAWTRLSLTGDKTHVFMQLIRIFWQNLRFLITTQINDAPTASIDDLKKITDVHVDFLNGLKSANPLKAKRTFRVKFEREEKDETTGSTNVEGGRSGDECTAYKNYQHALEKTAHEVCAHYFSYAIKNQISSPILSPLCALSREFDSQQLYEAILKTASSRDKVSLMDLYENYYDVWLKGDCMRSQVVVDLTFMLFNHLTGDNQCAILESFNKYPLSVLKWCISHCLTYPYSINAEIQKWLLGDCVHDALINFCKLVVKEGDKNYINLLKICFAQSDCDSLLISQRTCCEITLIFIKSLEDYDSENLNACALFATSLLSVSYVIADDNLLMKLLIGLFRFDCNSKKAQYVASDTLTEINSSWQDAISTLPTDAIISFVDGVSFVIHEKLIESSEVAHCLLTIETLVELSYDLIRACNKLLSDESESTYRIFSTLLKNKFEDLNKYINEIELYSLSAELIQGKFTCVTLTDDCSSKKIVNSCLRQDSISMNETELLHASSWVLYCAKLMERLVSYRSIDDSQDSPSEDPCDIVDTLPLVELKKSWMEILYSATIVKNLYSEYKMMKWSENLSKILIPIETSVVNGIKSLSHDNYLALLEELKSNRWNNALFWSYCIYFYEDVLNVENEESTFELSVNGQIEDFIKNETMDSLFDLSFCYKIQVIKNRFNIVNKKEAYLMATCIFALRQIKNKKFKNATDGLLSNEELKRAMNAPISLLSVVEEHMSLKELMSSDSTLTAKSWDEIEFNVSILQYLCACIDQHGWELQFREWDFITITLVSMLQAIAENMEHWDSIKVSSLSCAVFKLYRSMNVFVATILPECERREPNETILQLLNEWRDLVSPAVHSYLIDIFMKFCADGTRADVKISPTFVFFVSGLHEAMQVYEWKHVEKGDCPHNLNGILKICLDIMGTPCHHIMKYLSNFVLKSLIPTLINADKIASNKSEQPQPEIASVSTIDPIETTYSIHAFEHVLYMIQGCMETVLSPFKIGEDHCVLVPYSDSHSIALGYLLVWEILLDIAQESTAYLQHEYSEFFKNGQFVDQLLSVVFRLLPDELANLSPSSVASNYFKNPSILSFNTPISWELISSLACHRLLRCLQGGWLSALVRSWWGSLPTRSSQYVEQIIRTHISPLLIAEQLSMVSKKQKSIPDVEITIHTSVNEVHCIYVIEDLKMALSVQLCSNHPLNKPLVVSSGTPLNNMAWLSMYLSHQNGSVYQAIRMWANAVQKKVESTPVCYVCYCRLHPNTGQLPKMLCQTCKNKFHNVCLYKWFSTSGKATCPMCRNVFNIT